MTPNNKHLTLSKRIWILGSIALCNLLIFGAVAYTQAESMMGDLERAAHVQLPASRSMTLADMMHDGIRGVVMESLVTLAMQNPQHARELEKEAVDKANQFIDYIAQLEKLPIPESILASVRKIQPDINSYSSISRQMTSYVSNGKGKEAVALLPDFNEKFEVLEKGMEELGDQIQALAAETSDTGNQTLRRLLAFGIAAIAFQLIATFFVTRSITGTIREIVAKLSHLIESSTQNSEQLADSAHAVAASANEQMAAVQESTLSLTQIQTAADSTAKQAQESLATVETIRNSTASGQNSVAELDIAMADILSANSEIIKFGDMIEQIKSKTKMINTIVFKTQLLSFNASIESARAGESGRGFAVVANEVANLAETSGSAAKEIDSLIEVSEKQLREALTKIQARTEKGKDVAHLVKIKFGEIAESVQTATGKVGEIATLTQQQGAAITQAVTSNHQMESSAQKNSAVSQQAQHATGELRKVHLEIHHASDELGKLVLGSNEKAA